MIFKSFLLDNLVSLCMKIINSVVVVGLYYGFLTTFSIGPSYLFLLRAQVMEEPTEKKVSATTGFFMGQLIMLISIYYTPLHLALGRPHTITVLTLPYLLFHFFWNNHKLSFDDRPITSISMRNLNTQYIFLNNLVFQLFNHFLLPSSMVFRLVNIYMFQCNNKLLFVTSSFLGWLIGHIFIMKWLELILVWIRPSIRSTVLIRSTKYFVSELRNSMSRIFSILLFIICIYHLGGMPAPLLTKKPKEISERKERSESEEQIDAEIEEEIDVKMERTYETKRTKKGFTKEEEENFLCFDENPLVTFLFDYKRWNRPLRYIKNNRFENAVKNETSQYFYYTCQNDGKERISFTYPPSLSTFWEMIQRKKPLYTIYTTEKFFCEELNNYWIYTNEEKNNILNNEFRNRIEVLDTEYLYQDVLEKKNRLCNDKRKKKYLPKKYDPLLNGPYRGIKKKSFLPAMLNEIAVKNSIEKILINKVHSIIVNHYNCPKFEQKKNPFDKKSLSTEISHFLILISEFAGESISNLKRIFLFPEQGRISSKSREKAFNFLFDVVINHSIVQTTRKKSIGIKEINKKVPRWSYKLIDDLEQQEKENEENVSVDHQIRSRKSKRVVIFTDIQSNTDTYPNTKNTNNFDQADEVSLIRYSQQSDFRRDIIKGSMRVQRRKIAIWELLQANVHSPIFLDRIDKSSFFYFDIFGLIKRIFRKKKKEFQISNYTEEEKKDGDKKEEYEKEEEEPKRKETERIEIAETWDTIPFAQVIRGLMLVTQSILRKYIILPFLIIAKNIGRLLLFQIPEWSEDMKEWNREMHVKCTYNGVQLSEKEFPKNWLTDGIQIKILFPFRLKPWHRSKIRRSDREPMKKKEEKPKENFCFLTVWGMETELPFGSPRKRRSFFEPIFKELEKKIRKFRKKFFLALRIFKERTIFFLKVSKETKKWIINNLLFIKIISKNLSKVNPILVFELREDSSEIKKEKDSRMNNLIIHKSSIQTRSMSWKNFSLTEKKMKDLTDRTSTIKNKIERITKDKKNEFRTRNINPNKPSYGAKRIESICQILKRRNDRLIRKSHYFLKIFRENIYRNIFLYINIINIPRINTQPFLESKKKIIDTYSYNNERNQERIDKINQKKSKFISTIKNSLFISNIKKISNKNSKIFFDFSFLSQAHVFYKLSQTKVLNLYKLRSVLEYHGISLFLQNEIKDSFRTQGIIHSQLKHKRLQNSEMKQWKIWLKSNYQYNLSPIKWSKLVPQKWRNRINQHCKVKNQNLSKWDSYEKDQLIHYKKENDSEAHVLLKKKKKLKKTYRYDLLSYKFIYYEDNKDSYSYESPFQINKNQEKNSTYNYYNTHKEKKVAMWGNIPITNFLGKDDIIDVDKNPDRKFFDWRIINFFLRKKVDIEAWIDISTKSSKNTKTEINNYQIFDKIDKKGLFYLPIHQEINSCNQKKKLFDWMGMNEEILNRPISNFELWFFPEFVLFSNAYKRKPWIIPIKSLFFNFNVSEILNENKNINRKKKKDPFISSNEKKSLELENRNQEEKKTIGQGDHISDFQNQKSTLSKEQKYIEEDYMESEMKKRKNKKQNKSSTEVELDWFLKRYLLFQLRWDDPLNQKMINNIKVYCLLLRLKNPRQITISSIERREINLDIMLIPKDFTLTELMKKGILIIEPIRLSIKSDGQFFMYQTIGISLVHRSKDQKKSRSYENFDKNNFDESIARHQKMTKNRYKNHYDLLSPETILSPRRRRELRILICFNSKNVDKNEVFCNRNKVKIKNCGQFFDESKDLDKDKNKLIKFKLFLWPNYRLEDLACMNRYWFDTTNGSRFSMLRIHMYPPLKIH